MKTGKTRRGYGRKNGKKEAYKTNFSLLGANCNGILKKQASLLGTMSIFKPSIVTLQETKVRKSGRLKLKGYQIFENVRKDGNGGGLLTAADENLMPVLISTGKEDDSEILTIQVKAGNHDIRIINAYGPQEDDSNKDEIYRFWQEIEEEITNAKDDNCMIVIQMDANAKIGKKHVKNDPNDDTHNGRILIDVVERQKLVIVNTMELCKGVITRERITATNTERSVIDYIIICEDMKKFLEEMIIDEDRVHVLTKHTGRKQTVSDHNIMYSKLSIIYNPKPITVRKEFLI